MMGRVKQSRHIRRLFEILDDAQKLKLVAVVRDVAIERLTRVVAKVPRQMPERIKAAYRAKGISTAWDLTTTDAFEFYFAAQKAELSTSEGDACALLYFCTEALDKEAVPAPLQQSIVDAFAGCELTASEVTRRGHAKKQGRFAEALKHWCENMDPNLSGEMAAKELGLLFPDLSHKTLADKVRAEKKKRR